MKAKTSRSAKIAELKSEVKRDRKKARAKGFRVRKKWNIDDRKL